MYTCMFRMCIAWPFDRLFPMRGYCKHWQLPFPCPLAVLTDTIACVCVRVFTAFPCVHARGVCSRTRPPLPTPLTVRVACGRYKDSANRLQKIYLRLTWPNLMICDDEDDHGPCVCACVCGCMRVPACATVCVLCLCDYVRLYASSRLCLYVVCTCVCACVCTCTKVWANVRIETCVWPWYVDIHSHPSFHGH